MHASREKHLKARPFCLSRDLIEDILLKLPVKSLTRFKCVSNPWLALISEPKFAYLHYKRASAYPNNHKVLVLTRDSLQALDGQFLIDKGVSHNNLFAEIHVPFPFQSGGHGLFCSCNGLVCVCVNVYESEIFDIYLWNPSIGRHKKLPRSGLKNVSFLSFGFGYDDSIDDYKIVRPFKSRTENICHGKIEIEVFSLKKNSWRTIPNLTCNFRIPFGTGTYFNGAIHWVVTETPRRIMYFDLRNERFYELPEPDAGLMGQVLSLVVLEGCLCLCSFQSRKAFEVWVMKECNVKKSWTILALLLPDFSRKLVPLFKSGTNEALMFSRTGRKLSMYNLENRKSRLIFSSRDSDFHVAMHVESIASPDSYEDGAED